MLEVKVENIIPVTEARDRFNQLIDGVEGTDDLYVMTKNGKPSAILVGVHHLEKLTGESHAELMGEAKEAEAKTPDTAEADDTLETPVEPIPSSEPPMPANDEAPMVSNASAPAETPTPSGEPFTYDNATSDMIDKAAESTPTIPVPPPAPVDTTTPIPETPTGTTPMTPTTDPLNPPNPSPDPTAMPGATPPSNLGSPTPPPATPGSPTPPPPTQM